MPVETNTSHTGKRFEQTLQEHPRSCKASGATPAGALARPHGTAQQPGGKNVPSASIGLCGFLTDITVEARGLLSGTAIRVPDNREKTSRLTQSRHGDRSPRPWQPQRPIKRSAPAPLGRNSASLEGTSAVPLKLHLARGLAAPSGETPPHSRLSRVRRSRTHSPDRSIKCSDTTWAPGSKGESPPHRPLHGLRIQSRTVSPTLPMRPSPPLYDTVR
jgi:hypothetical protein